MECLLGAFGAPLDLLGDPGGSFAISLERLGSSGPTLGRPLAPRWPHFADPWLLLATTWVHFGIIFDAFGLQFGSERGTFSCCWVM